MLCGAPSSYVAIYMRVHSTDKRAPSKQLNLNLSRYQQPNSMTTYCIATTKKSPIITWN